MPTLAPKESPPVVRTAVNVARRDMSKPVVVELDLGGDKVVPFTLTEASMRSHPNPAVRMAFLNGEAEHDLHYGMMSAAVTIVEHLLDPKRDPDRPISVANDDAMIFVPLRSIRSVRLLDPDASNGRTIGFPTDYAELLEG